MPEPNEFTITISKGKHFHVQFEDKRGLIEIDTRGEHPSVTVLDYDMADADFMAFDFSQPKELKE